MSYKPSMPGTAPRVQTHQQYLSPAMTGSPAYHPFPNAQFHRASESQIHYYVRQIEADCPHVFGFCKQAFPTDIGSEVYSMLTTLRDHAGTEGFAAGPVRGEAGDAELHRLADTITTDQLDALQLSFGMIEQRLASAGVTGR